MKTTNNLLRLGAVTILTGISLSSQQAHSATLIHESFSQTAGNINGLAGETGLNS